MSLVQVALRSKLAAPFAHHVHAACIMLACVRPCEVFDFKWTRTMVGTMPTVLPSLRCWRENARMLAASVKICSSDPMMQCRCKPALRERYLLQMCAERECYHALDSKLMSRCWE